MEYAARIIKEDDAYIVEFPDIPGAITYGETLEEAKANAKEALDGCLESDFERGVKHPEPKPHKGRNFYPIVVAAHIALAYQLRDLRGDRTQMEIARDLDISYQAYQKLENPRKCNPTIKTLEHLSEILDKRLVVDFA